MENEFNKELSKIGKQAREYIEKSKYSKLLKPKDILVGSLSYPKSSGKALRPAILMFACGAVGGDIKKAKLAAAAVELYHTWTLVHDDIIDHGKLRRGNPTVHEYFYNKSKDNKYSEEEATDYGRNIAILVGDIQHSWSVWLLTELVKSKVKPEVVLSLISEMESRVSPLLIEGETLDIQYEKKKVEDLSISQILDMSAKKTGELYSFAARAGAMIGKNVSNPKDKDAEKIANFCFNAGVAFQLQDDILDLTSKEKKFGKEIGGDIKEGKRTTIIWYAYNKANTLQKKELSNILGNKKATKKEIARAISLIEELGGIENTKKLALTYIKKAKKYLEGIPESKYKKLLLFWADFMVERSV
ncbi:polyprenyl synthetase family protein [bacterium]|nr:polyprenyl synthetase family protein [bacterium]